MREGWHWKTLREVCRLHYGKALRQKDRVPGSVPVVGSSGPFGVHSTANTETAGGSIVVGRKGTAGSVTKFAKDVWVTDTAYWAEPLDDTSLNFLFLLLQGADLPSITAQTGVPGLNRDRAYELQVRLPPIDEQRRIVDIIGSIDDAIEKVGLVVDKSAALARAMRAIAFPSAMGETSTARAGDIFDMLLGRQKSAAQSVGDHVIPYLRAANIRDGEFDLGDLKRMNFDPSEQEKYGVREGDVMLVEGGSIGLSALWGNAFPGTVGFDKHVIRLRARDGQSIPEYALQWTKWARESGQFAEQATGVTIKALGFGRASAMPVPNLPFDEQSEFVAALSAADAVVSDARTSVSKLRGLRSDLLTVLLSGEHEIPESYDSLMEEVAA